MNLAFVSSGSPVDCAMETVAPEHTIGSDIHINGHGILLRGNNLRVVSLHKVNATDLMPVSEHQVGTLSCKVHKKMTSAFILIGHVFYNSSSDWSAGINALVLIRYGLYGNSSLTWFPWLFWKESVICDTPR